jgi:RNA-directed DNA polymerase
VSLTTPANLRKLQRALYATAKRDPARRFHVLYDKVWREDILAHAFALSRKNGGAPGVDGVSFAQIETYGVARWLGELREEVRTGRYTPQPVRRVMIPKSGGVGQRPLGIPTIRDRVVQTAAKLVIEPIFEADFDEAAYGYRPRRSAQEAIRAVHKAVDDGRTEVVDADLSQYFDTIPHAALMRCLARRISDGRMLHLLKGWLKVPVAEPDERGAERMSGGKRATRGTPQGGVVSPLLANIYIHRYIKAFRRYGLDQKYGAQLVIYADDLVVLCRHGAHEVLEKTRGWMGSMGHRLHQGGDPARVAAWEPSAVGGGGQSSEPHGAGLGGVLLLRIVSEGAPRCAAAFVSFGAPLSPTTAQAGRAWVSAVPRDGGIRGTGRSGSGPTSAARPCECRP